MCWNRIKESVGPKWKTDTYKVEFEQQQVYNTGSPYTVCQLLSITTLCVGGWGGGGGRGKEEM